MDAGLAKVAARLRALDPTGERFAGVVRRSIDHILDGQRTGRWSYDQLSKTEKTHLGTLVELNLALEFEFDEGEEIDYRIADEEVDCKWSRSDGDWEIPREMYLNGKEYLALLVWGADAARRCKAGLLRIRADRLRASANQDGKRRLTPEAYKEIEWVWDVPLPDNLLYHLSAADRDAILEPRSGQRRMDELFRRVQGRIVDRTAVVTVARQADSPKRARDARLHLRPEGILVLGHQESDPVIAAALGLPVPRKGEWVAARVKPAPPGATGARIAGREWVLAGPADPPQAAPHVPRAGRDDA